MDQTLTVTTYGPTTLIRTAGVRSDVKLVAERLREHGWLDPELAKYFAPTVAGKVWLGGVDR